MKKRLSLLLVAGLLICTGCGNQQESNNSETHVVVDDTQQDETEPLSDDSTMSIGEYLKTKESIWYDLQSGVAKDSVIREAYHFKDGKVEFFDLSETSNTLGDASKMSLEEQLAMCKEGNEKTLDAKIKQAEEILDGDKFKYSAYSDLKEIYQKYYEKLLDYKSSTDHFGEFTIYIETDDSGNNTEKEGISVSYTNQFPREKINYLMTKNETYCSDEEKPEYSHITPEEGKVYYKNHFNEWTELDINEVALYSDTDKIQIGGCLFSKIEADLEVYDSKWNALSYKAPLLCSLQNNKLTLDSPSSSYVDMIDPKRGDVFLDGIGVEY